MGLKYEEIIQICIISFLLLTFNVLCWHYLKYVKANIGEQALYERSEHLLVIANISNFSETIMNIIAGTVAYVYKIDNTAFLMFYYIFATYSTRFYACCMALRIYRIKYLYQTRAGLVKNPGKLCESRYFNVIIMNLYSLAVTGIYFAIYFGYSQNDANMNFVRAVYCLEALGFLFSSYKYYSIAKHPSIPVEYFFYALIWMSGIYGKGEIRTVYEVPIRNSILLMISLLSIYYHVELLRPPLPSDINIMHIFEMQELFNDFECYVNTYGSPEEIKACRQYKELMIFGRFTSNFSDYLLRSFRISRSFTENSFENPYYSEIKEVTEVILLQIIRKYLDSPEHLQMKKDYFIKFN